MGSSFSLFQPLPSAQLWDIIPLDKDESSPSGIGSFVGAIAIVFMFAWTADAISFSRTWQVLKSYIDVYRDDNTKKLFTVLNETTEDITVPSEFLMQFSRRQINSLLKSTSFIPPAVVQPYVSPFSIRKNTIKLAFKKLSNKPSSLPVFDLSFQIDFQIPCIVEVYTCVGFSAVTRLFERISDRSKQNNRVSLNDAGIVISPTDSDFYLIPVVGELSTPSSPVSPQTPSDSMEKALEKLEWKAFSRTSVTPQFTGRKLKMDMIVPDLPYIGEGIMESNNVDVSASDQTSLRQDALLEIQNKNNNGHEMYIQALLNVLKETTKEESSTKEAARVPYLILIKPIPNENPTLPVYYKTDFKGNIQIENSLCVCLIWGKVKNTNLNSSPVESDLPDVNSIKDGSKSPLDAISSPPVSISPAKSEKNDVDSYEFSQESVRLLYHIPSAASSKSAYSWFEHDEIFGSSSSNQDLSAQPAESSGAGALTTEYEPKSQLCVICLSDPAQVIVSPCRHCCTCLECWRLDAVVQISPVGPSSQLPAQNSSTNSQPSSPRIVSQQPVVVAERVSVKWTTCPVCRGAVEGWVEMNDKFTTNFVNN